MRFATIPRTFPPSAACAPTAADHAPAGTPPWTAGGRTPTQCRLPGCAKTARTPTGFCTDQHWERYHEFLSDAEWCAEQDER